MTSPYVGQSGRFFACGIRIRKILTSEIQNAGLRNPEYGSRIRNPTERLESGVQVSLTKNTESSTWNPESMALERFSYGLEKWFRKVFVICFISQWMKRSKHGLFVFPPKKTLIWGRHFSIGQWCCSMTSKRSIDWFLESSRAWEVFSPERSLNQSKATSVCIRSTNQSYCSISVRLFFLFCSRVFVSKSYENRSKCIF